MNTLGKTAPSLINPKLLKEIMRTPDVPKSDNIISIDKTKIFNFMYHYGIFIFIFLSVTIYVWRRYIWYQGVKEEKMRKVTPVREPYVNPGQYVRQDNDVQLLQRPIPEYKTNSMNKEIRNMYLDKLDRKEIRPSQSLPMRVSSKRGCRNNDDRLDNIYGQPVYQYDDGQWSGSIGWPGPLGRNAPLRADVPDCDDFYEFYSSE